MLNPSEKPSIFFVVYPDRANPDKPRVQIESLADGQSFSTKTIELPSPDASASIPVLVDSAAQPGNCEVRITATQGNDSARKRPLLHGGPVTPGRSVRMNVRMKWRSLTLLVARFLEHLSGGARQTALTQCINL